MKRILKLSSCNILTIYEKKYPIAKWDKGVNNFKSYRKNTLYHRLKKQIFQDQGQLCAYCESKIINIHKQRVEHFNDKSNSTLTNNLHLKWDNIFGVCLGGSDIRNKENPIFPTPKNLSCDAYKAHKKVQHTEFLNPLKLQAFPTLFKFEKKSGKLQVDEDKCREADIDIKLVKDTIINLNLNCDRLVTDRYEVFKAYNIAITKGRKAKDRDVSKKLANQWFSQKYPNFFTTRRILLGKHAEEYLRKINYDG